MIDRSKQIIPDLEAVARCLDPEMLEILDSHGILTISDLLEIIKEPIAPSISREELNLVFDKSTTLDNYSRDDFFNNLNTAIAKNPGIKILLNILTNGTTCNLLQPDGTGWQKGKLKMCFEFIPEENEPVVMEKAPVEAHRSPLDELRQLSNELTSGISIEQN